MKPTHFLNWKFACLLAGWVLFWSGNAPAQELEVGCLDFPPFYVVKADNPPEGPYIDFLKDVLNMVGEKYRIVGYPPARLYHNLAIGKTNIWMGTKGVAAYEGKVIVSPEKITDIHLRVYAIGNKPLPKSMEDLKGKTLIAIFGYNYGGVVKYLTDPANNITLDTASTHELALRKLFGGRADYLLDYKEPVEKTLKGMSPLPDLRYSELSKIELYFNISKSTPNAEALMQKMMDAYHALRTANKIPF